MQVLVLKPARAIFARVLFAIHAFLTIGWAAKTFDNDIFWMFTLLIAALFVEGSLNIYYRQGRETRWFCVSIFIYLCATVPPLWLLDGNLRVHQRERIMDSSQRMRNLEEASRTGTEDLARLNSSELLNLIHTMKGHISPASKYSQECEDILQILPDGSTLPICLDKEVWVAMLEQTLLVVLILGRWILPKGEISRDQLSQILLVYLATGADIVELFETFKEPSVLFDTAVVELILIVWTVSLFQFPLVITHRARKSRLGALEQEESTKLEQLQLRPGARLSVVSADAIPVSTESGVSLAHRADVYFAPPKPVWKRLLKDMNVWGIMVTLCLQDGPFVSVRLYLMIRHGTVSYSMIFFTCKNLLICMLLIYRLCAILQEVMRKYREENIFVIIGHHSHRSGATHDSIEALDIESGRGPSPLPRKFSRRLQRFLNAKRRQGHNEERGRNNGMSHVSKEPLLQSTPSHAPLVSLDDDMILTVRSNESDQRKKTLEIAMYGSERRDSLRSPD